MLFGIDIRPDCRQIRYITGSHTPQRRLAAKKMVGSGNPCVGQLRIGVNDLKRLPNTGDIANAPEVSSGNLAGGVFFQQKKCEQQASRG